MSAINEPVARLLHWQGDKDMTPFGGKCARTFDEVPLNQSGNMWREGEALFLHKQDSRIRLELEVANENAAHHKAECEKRGQTIHEFRKLLRATQLLLETGNVDYIDPDTEQNARKLEELIRKELG